MKKLILSLLVLSASLFAADNQYKYEVTPTIGGQHTDGTLDDSLIYGLRFGAFLDNQYIFDLVEIGYERGDDIGMESIKDEIDASRVFLNLVEEYELNQKNSLYTLIGAGYEDIDGDNGDNDSCGFANYGFGWRYKLAERFHIKTELRHMVNFSDGDNGLLGTVGFAIPFGKVAKAAPYVKPVMPVVHKPYVEPKPVDGDDDKDSVLNSMDKCPGTAIGVIVDEDGCPKIVNLKVHFDTDKAIVKPEFMGEITKFAEFLKLNKRFTAAIEGHTDSVASDAYNQKLSQRRAEAVMQEIIKLGVEKNRISAKGYGESKPVASNSTKEGRAKNRRVQGVLDK